MTVAELSPNLSYGPMACCVQLTHCKRISLKYCASLGEIPQLTRHCPMKIDMDEAASVFVHHLHPVIFLVS
jgi:hypothetical protein